MCERLLANPLIEDYEVLEAGRMKFGVVRFPGSCDEVDALLACERFGDAEMLWHGDRDLQRRRRRRRPRRLLLRRLPARRRDRPLLAGDGGGRRVRPRRRAGARHLQRLPGALRGGAAARARCCRTTSLRFVCRQVDVEVVQRRHCRSRARAASATCSRSRSSTRPAATTRRPARRWRHTSRSCCATRPGHNPNGSLRDIAGVVQRAPAT